MPAIYFRIDPTSPAQKDFIVCKLLGGPIEREKLARQFTKMYGPDKRRSFNTQFARLRKADKIEETDGCVQLVE